jgi:chorismate synthase
MLRFVTAGESHGKCLTGILEGLPAGLEIDRDFINEQLKRRQSGYGRGGRMQIERDMLGIVAGVRHGKTLGSPIAFTIQNRDWPHWETVMSPEPVPEGVQTRPLTRPRPGHGDLAGGLKYQTHDLREILERASARETAARVAVGAFCRIFLTALGMTISSHVLAVGQCRVAPAFENEVPRDLASVDAESSLHCPDPDATKGMMALIDQAKVSGDTLGGIVEVAASGVPPGLGSHSQWDAKLDGLLGQALMSVPAAKAVEIGQGISAAQDWGSKVHDEIFYSPEARRFFRKTNRAGGIEAGISNGADLRVRIYFKPIPTLRKPLMSVDVLSKQAQEAAFERSDICVVPAAAVICESMLAFVLARAFLEKFGGDSIGECQANYGNYKKLLDEY